MSNSITASSLPTHVGVIMDGNGRWAESRGLPRNKGHKKGVEVLAETVRHAKKLGIRYLTVYAFSTENWNRPPQEVRGIMDLLRGYLKNADNYRKENVCTRILGEISALDEDLRELIQKVEKNSAANDGINVNIAINYGGRDEIVHAAKAVAQKILNGEAALEQVDEAMLAGEMYTRGQPDVDLTIRTGGERRISNFLLWQSAYAELVFCDVHWPDFSPKDFDDAIAQYGARVRRMGGV